jgi:hypothetical protein
VIKTKLSLLVIDTIGDLKTTYLDSTAKATPKNHQQPATILSNQISEE